jgi:hypothetical protein
MVSVENSEFRIVKCKAFKKWEGGKAGGEAGRRDSVSGRFRVGVSVKGRKKMKSGRRPLPFFPFLAIACFLVFGHFLFGITNGPVR